MLFKNLFGKKTDEEDWDDWDEETHESSTPVNQGDLAKVQEMSVRARAFSDYNQRKIQTIISKLRDLDQQIFKMLPALVHLNLLGLPGFVEDDDLAYGGISGFQVDQQVQRLLQNHFKNLTVSSQTFMQLPKGPRIHSLAAMGSLATIGQTAKSDFDMWVCINKKEFTEEQLRALAHKLEAIEEWAEKKNHFESHFFITDIEEAKYNRFGASDSESAGFALGKLLKEEFFRTQTVLAGYPPLWILMPPNISDEEYEHLRAVVGNNYQLEPTKFIDLGTSQHVTMEEAFGAALWQLNKALGSPFKSAMKMALIEDYMDPKSDPVLLCDRLKETMTMLAAKQGRQTEGDSLGPDGLLDQHEARFDLDGYLLMFNRILDYFKRKGQEDQEDILRKCFYLKVGETITGIHDPSRTKSPKKDMLGQLVEGWGWENEKIIDLNNFKNWTFDRNVALGKQVNAFIIDSYKRLSESGATSEVRINQNDLTVLGRKLFTFYSRKENKIDFLPRIFDESLKQDQLTFVFASGARGAASGTWKVFRDAVSATELQSGAAESKLLRQTRNLIGLLIWLVMNGLWDRGTHVGLSSPNSPVSAADIQDLLGAMLDFLPPIDVGHLSNDALLREAEAEKVFAVLNLGSQKLVEKIQRIDLLYRTSWGEIYYKQPTGKVDQLGALHFCMQQIPTKGENINKAFKLFVPSGKAGLSNRQVYTDFEQTVNEMVEHFYASPDVQGALRSYVFQGEGGGVSSFTWDGEKLSAARHPSFDEFFLKRERGTSQRHFMKIGASPTKLIMPQVIAGKFQQEVIQVFVYNDGIKARAYIKDEMGGTMLLSLPPKVWPIYGPRLASFLENISKRLAAEPVRLEDTPGPPAIAFYNVVTTGTHHNQFVADDVTDRYLGRGQVQAEVECVNEETGADGKQVLVFQTPGGSISSAAHGGNIFREVASQVYERRPKKGKHAIFLGDLELPKAFRQKNCPNGAKTLHFLIYKKMLESRLNEALKAL